MTSPTLPLPFVWLAGVEAAPLLAPLAGRTLPRETVLAQWRRITPHAESMIETLMRTGVLA